MIKVNSSLFSICIPNFNYAKYLALTCESVLSQSVDNYEILIADNQSTDGSIDYIKALAESNQKIRYTINPVNLGFTGNLEKVTSMARGEWYLLLSSDDLMNKGALAAYTNLIDKVGDRKDCVIGASVFRIDSNGNTINRDLPDPDFWRPNDIHPELTQSIGYTVYAVNASEMLSRSLTVMGNPYYFLTVCYPNSLFSKVGGYGGGRMYNPDKWFNWRLLAEANTVYLIDEPLFSYRWHTQNQVSLESSKGHLKFLVDEYRNTIELTESMLTVASVSRQQSVYNFIKRDIYRHGMGEYSKGRWQKSLRIYFFGLSCYPGDMIRNAYFLIYTILLLTTPVGAWLVSRFRK